MARPLRAAVLRGLRGRCPACGDSALFDRFLKPATHCSNCRQSWTGHEADDFPSYIVILLVGHLVVPMMVEVELGLHPPLWVHMSLWPPTVLLLALLLIQPVKGGVIAFQWARRMHGFEDGPADQA